jgi:hypothetical protein
MPRTKEELETIVHDDELIERGKGIFAAKWVEKIVFWLVVTFASAVVLALIDVYVVQPLIRK